MLYLLFEIGKNRYALEARHAVEVLPFLDLEKIPQAPRGVAGSFNYRGQPVVAVDLCELTLGRPARELLSTRIIVMKCQVQGARCQAMPHLTPDPPHLAPMFGLIAEHATGIMRREVREFVTSGLKPGNAPNFGPVATDDQGVIQLFEAEHWLTETVRQAVFSETADSARGTSSEA